MTTENETQETIPFEHAVQRVFNWIIDRIPVANNADKDWIKAHVDALFTDPNAEPVVEPVTPPAPVQPPATTPVAPAVAPIGSSPTQTETQADTTENMATLPESYPLGGSSEDIRAWYSTATDDEIAQVAAFNAGQ